MSGDCCAFKCISQSPLFLWTNPVNSACVLAALNAVLLLTFVDVCWFSLISNVGLAALALGALAKLVFKADAAIRLDEVFPKADVEKYTLFIYDVVNGAVAKVCRLLLWTDMSKSLQAGAVLYALGALAAILNIKVAALLAVNALFCIPPVYAKNQHQIDTVLAPQFASVAAVVKDAYNSIPRARNVKKVD